MGADTRATSGDTIAEKRCFKVHRITVSIKSNESPSALISIFRIIFIAADLVHLLIVIKSQQ